MQSALAIIPRVPVSVRAATMADLSFMDALQKAHSKQLGYFPTKQFEGYIAQGAVLIAEASDQFSIDNCQFSIVNSDGAPQTRIGYAIAKDRYLKRDELGVVYQLCVAPGNQRKLIGASLLKAVFERSAYGCRLYCCWCAQDLDANYFWESMGFVPIAFRAGSTGKRRVHIFWQRRINADDHTTAYWYPSQTNAGAIREDRLVFPIPPGTHWSDVKPIVLPRERGVLPEPKPAVPRKRSGETPKPHVLTTITAGGLRFGAPKVAAAEPVKVKREKPPKVKNDPKHVAAARELRDRYLEHVNAGLPAPAGKYAVARQIDARPVSMLGAA